MGVGVGGGWGKDKGILKRREKDRKRTPQRRKLSSKS